MAFVRRLCSVLELVLLFWSDIALSLLPKQHVDHTILQDLSIALLRLALKPTPNAPQESDTNASQEPKAPSTIVATIPDDLSVAHGISTPHISRTICDFLDAHAAAYPTSLAVQDILDNQLTYGDLQARSLHLAQQLKKLGVRRGSRVCLVLERSIEHVVALFAVLRLGAAYIPLDGLLVPQSVLENVVCDAQPAVILVSRTHIARSGSADGKWCCIEDLLEAREQTGPMTAFNDARSRDPAYIIFTSGIFMIGRCGLRCALIRI